MDFGEFESSTDPTADFLAREKELLGDDAALFDQPAAGGSLASAAIDDEFGDFTTESADLEIADAAAAFPPAPVISSSPAMPSGAYPASSPAPQQSLPPASPVPTQNTGASAKYEDSEFITQWREKQAEVLANRDRKSEEKHAQMLDKAKADLDQFYKEYNDKKAKMRSLAAEEDAAESAGNVTVQGANVWERVVALADLSSGGSGATSSPTSTTAPILKAKSGKDTSRMRQVLIQLKNDPTAPLNK